MDRTNRPGIPITLVASAARTTSSNSGNLKDTTANWPSVERYAVTLDVTAHTAAAATDTFNVYLDQSPDGGTTWLQAQQFTAVTQSTSQNTIYFRRGVAVSEATITGTTVATSTTAKIGNPILTRDVRVRWEPVTSAVSIVVSPAVSVTFAVYLIADPD